MYTDFVFAILIIFSVAGFVICFNASNAFSVQLSDSFVVLGYAFCLLFLAIMAKVLYFTWIPIFCEIFSIILAVYSILNLIRRNQTEKKEEEEQENKNK